MGTRNLTCVQKDKKIVVAKYCQWDGYPTGQGKIIIDFIKNKFDKDLFIKKLSMVSKATQKDIYKLWKSIGVDIDKCNGMVTFEDSDKFNEKWPWLHRDMGGEILNVIQNLNTPIVLNYDKNFALDGLFCEWVYVLNLDEDTLDIYQGFSKKHSVNIFCETKEKAEKHKHKESGYYPVVKIDSISFKTIKRLKVDTVINNIKKEAQQVRG